MLLLTRRITRHPAALANAARTQPRRTAAKTITRIGRYKARIAAQTARKTSWAAPEAPSWLRRVEHWLRPPAPSGDPLQLLPWELTSPVALETRGDAARDADLLSYAGVVVRRNAVCRDAVAACRVRAEELAAEATRRAAAAGADAGDASAGFHFADASPRPRAPPLSSERQRRRRDRLRSVARRRPHTRASRRRAPNRCRPRAPRATSIPTAEAAMGHRLALVDGASVLLSSTTRVPRVPPKTFCEQHLQALLGGV